jgi:hypothetical protein
MNIPSINALFLLILLTLLGTDEINAQEIRVNAKKNTFFAEYSLEGPDYSVNYDRIFARSKKLTYTFRVGFFAIKDKTAIPLGLTILTGKNDHHAAFGLTLTPQMEIKRSIYGGKNNDKSMYVFPSVGYRYQQKKGGIFLHAATGPLINMNPPAYNVWDITTTVAFSFSLGLGYTFGK